MSSRAYFEQVASQWDQMRQGFYSESVRDKALSIAGVEEGRTAADIGGGTGFMTEGLVAKGLRVIAVDQSESMLATMKSKFAGTDAVDYRVGDADRLPIADQEVDYAFANMYLHHVDSPPTAIREMARTLKRGGKLVITDLDKHGFEFLRQEHHDRWMGFDREEVKRWLEEAGLLNVVVGCADEACCAESDCGDRFAAISIFVASGEK